MTFRDDIVTITTNDGTITALISDRMYPDRRHEGITDPSLVYIAFISDNNTHSRDQEGAGRTMTRVQFESWADRSRTAHELADAVETLWNGYQDDARDIGFAWKVNRLPAEYHQQLDQYRVIVDVMIEHGEP